MTTTRRDRSLDWLSRLLPVEASVFAEIPFERYTVFVRSDTLVNGGGLEHQNSQIDEVLRTQLGADLSGIYAYEMFHTPIANAAPMATTCRVSIPILLLHDGSSDA